MKLFSRTRVRMNVLTERNDTNPEVGRIIAVESDCGKTERGLEEGSWMSRVSSPFA